MRSTRPPYRPTNTSRISVPAIHATALALCLLSPIDAQGTGRVAWLVSDGGNDHCYEVVYAPLGISWTNANAAAKQAGGHLATITSQRENDFVFALVNRPQYWFQLTSPWVGIYGPWIGGIQATCTPEPRCGWTWVTGETWSFTAWAIGEPNDSCNSTSEAQLQFAGGAGATTPAATWNDLLDRPCSGILVKAYVIEYDTPAQTRVYGSGCSTQSVPALTASRPVTNQILTLTAIGGPTDPRTVGFVFLGLGSASIPIGHGCVLYVDPATALASIPLSYSSGTTWQTILGPASVCLTGVSVFAQAGFLGTSGPQGFDLSNGVELLFGT